MRENSAAVRQRWQAASTFCRTRPCSSPSLRPLGCVGVVAIIIIRRKQRDRTHQLPEKTGDHLLLDKANRETWQHRGQALEELELALLVL